MKVVKTSVVLLTMAMLATAGWAQTGKKMEQETLELRLGGGMQFQNANGNTAFSLDPALGYFVFDDIEVGGKLFWAYNGNDFGYGLGAFTEYNLDMDAYVVPFAGLGLGYQFGDYYLRSHVLIELTAGLKEFLSNDVAIYQEFYYDLASEEVYLRDEKTRSYDTGLRIGVRCYF